MSTRSKSKQRGNHTDQWAVDYLIFTFICILLFYPPFFRGLFFQKELLVTHILTFTLAALWLVSKLKSDTFQIIHSVADVLALGIVFMYFVSIFYAVNIRSAIAEFLKYANYLVLYLMIRDFAIHHPQKKKTIRNVLLFSGAIVAIIGIGSAIGTFHYNGAFVSGRINSTFQYPNTLAAYLFALFIIALGQLQNSENIKERYFYAALCNLYIFTFIPTFSRGMWLLAPVIYVFYFLLIPMKKKLEILNNSFMTMIPALLFSMFFIQGMEKGNPLLQWGLLILSILTTLGLIHLSEKWIRSIEKISYKAILTVVLSFILVLTIGATIVLHATQPLVLSNMGSQEDVYKSVTRDISNIFKNKEYRLEVQATVKNPQNKAYAGRIDIYSINGEEKPEILVSQNVLENGRVITPFTTIDTTESVRIRLTNYYRDTEAVFDEAVVYDVQTGEKIQELKLSYKYIPEKLIMRISSITAGDNSVQGRMSFYKDAFQIIKDYPLFGAGGGAWAALYFKYQSYMYWTTQAHNHFLQLWIETGTVGLLIYLAFLGTLLFSVYRTLRKTDDAQIKIMEISTSIAWLTILAHSIMDFDLSLGAMSMLLWSFFAITEQDIPLKKKQIFQGNPVRYAAIAIVFALAVGAGSLHMGQRFASQAIEAAKSEGVLASIQYFEKAAKYDPFTATYRADLATLYAMAGKKDSAMLEKSIENLEKATRLDPYNTAILVKAAEISFQRGKVLDGLGYLDKAVEVQPMNIENYLDQTKGYLAAINFFVNKQDMKNLSTIIDKIPSMKNKLDYAVQNLLQPFRLNADLDLNLQKLDYVVDYKDDINKRKELKSIKLYNYFKNDLDKNNIPDGTSISNTEKGKLKLQQQEQYVSLSNEGTDYGVFWVDVLQLQKNRKYTLEIEYSSTLQDENLDLYLYDSSSGQTKIIARLDNLPSSQEFTKERMEFITPEGIATGKQRIGIIHRGNDQGIVNIRKVSVMEESE